MKKVWTGCALFVAVGGALCAVPSVRDWFHDQLPWLGINGSVGTAIDTTTVPYVDAVPSGNSARIMASYASHSNYENGVERSLPSESTLVGSGDKQDNAPMPLVRLAQATLPIQNPSLPLGPSTTLGAPRVAQSSLTQVPQNGIGVPAANQSAPMFIQVASLNFIPNRDIEVAASADGLITRLYVDDGAVVKEGDPLFELDPRIAQAEVTVQTKELEQARLKADDDSNIKYANAAFKVAEVDYQKSNELVLQGAEDEMTNQKKGLEKKKAELQIRVSTIEHAKDISSVGVSEAKLNAAKTQLELRQFRAPWTGIANDMKKGQFTYVRAGEVLFRLTDLSKLRVSGRLKVTVPPHLLLKAPARVTITVAPGIVKTIDGVVGYVSPRTTDASGDTYYIWVEIDNELVGEGQYLFRQGMSATVEIMQSK